MFEKLANYLKNTPLKLRILFGVIPFIGLFLAYTFEISYFQVLGIPVRMLFETSDIVRSSIFVVLPLAGAYILLVSVGETSA